MPVEATNVIVSETAGEVVRAKMRNHWIKVYPASQIPKYKRTDPGVYCSCTLLQVRRRRIS